jgi:thioredoxin reductase (NADPH)
MDHNIYDIIILGTGPAGLQAAIHAARTKVSVLVMGREHKSSLFRAHVENYCCITGVSGGELLQQGVKQALDSGALTLLFYANKVHLVSDKLQVSERLNYQIQESDVDIHLGHKVTEIIGDDTVRGLIMDNGQKLDVDGVFIETGAKGAVELAATLGVALDAEKFQYIVTDMQQQTNIKGIYAAGDICGPPWQMAKAVGEGCVAGLAAAKYAKKMKGQSTQG